MLGTWDKYKYYRILELDLDASSDEVRKSYRKLSIKYHPDKNPDYVEKMSQITNAHGILSDRKKKREYDLCLSEVNEVEGTGEFDKDGNEKMRGIEIVENVEKFAQIKDQVVSSDFAQQVIQVIEDELAEEGLSYFKLLESHIVYLANKRDKEKDQQEWKKWDSKINYYWKDFKNEEGSKNYWKVLLELFVKDNDNCELFLYAARKYLDKIKTIRQTRQREKEIEAGIQAKLAEIEKWLNLEPTLNYRGYSGNTWMELHPELWRFEKDLRWFSDRESSECESQVYEEVKFDTRVRRAVKKYLLEQLDRLIEEGEQILEQDELDGREIQNFTYKLTNHKSKLRNGEIKEGEGFLAIFNDFARQEAQLKAEKKIWKERLRAFSSSDWKILGEKVWLAREEETDDLRDNLNHWRQLVLLRRLEKYAREYLSQPEASENNLLNEIQSQPKWKVNNISIHQSHSDKVQAVIQKVQAELENTTEKTDIIPDDRPISAADKTKIENYLKKLASDTLGRSSGINLTDLAAATTWGAAEKARVSVVKELCGIVSSQGGSDEENIKKVKEVNKNFHAQIWKEIQAQGIKWGDLSSEQQGTLNLKRTEVENPNFSAELVKRKYNILNLTPPHNKTKASPMSEIKSLTPEQIKRIKQTDKKNFEKFLTEKDRFVEKVKVVLENKGKSEIFPEFQSIINSRFSPELIAYFRDEFFTNEFTRDEFVRAEKKFKELNKNKVVKQLKDQLKKAKEQNKSSSEIANIQKNLKEAEEQVENYKRLRKMDSILQGREGSLVSRLEPDNSKLHSVNFNSELERSWGSFKYLFSKAFILKSGGLKPKAAENLFAEYGRDLAAIGNSSSTIHTYVARLLTRKMLEDHILAFNSDLNSWEEELIDLLLKTRLEIASQIYQAKLDGYFRSLESDYWPVFHYQLSRSITEILVSQGFKNSSIIDNQVASIKKSLKEYVVNEKTREYPNGYLESEDFKKNLIGNITLVWQYLYSLQKTQGEFERCFDWERTLDEIVTVRDLETLHGEVETGSFDLEEECKNDNLFLLVSELAGLDEQGRRRIFLDETVEVFPSKTQDFKGNLAQLTQDYLTSLPINISDTDKAKIAAINTKSDWVIINAHSLHPKLEEIDGVDENNGEYKGNILVDREGYLCWWKNEWKISFEALLDLQEVNQKAFQKLTDLGIDFSGETQQVGEELEEEQITEAQARELDPTNPEVKKALKHKQIIEKVLNNLVEEGRWREVDREFGNIFGHLEPQGEGVEDYREVGRLAKERVGLTRNVYRTIRTLNEINSYELQRIIEPEQGFAIKIDNYIKLLDERIKQNPWLKNEDKEHAEIGRDWEIDDKEPIIEINFSKVGEIAAKITAEKQKNGEPVVVEEIEKLAEEKAKVGELYRVRNKGEEKRAVARALAAEQELGGTRLWKDQGTREELKNWYSERISQNPLFKENLEELFAAGPTKDGGKFELLVNGKFAERVPPYVLKNSRERTPEEQANADEWWIAKKDFFVKERKLCSEERFFCLELVSPAKPTKVYVNFPNLLKYAEPSENYYIGQQTARNLINEIHRTDPVYPEYCKSEATNVGKNKPLEIEVINFSGGSGGRYGGPGTARLRDWKKFPFIRREENQAWVAIKKSSFSLKDKNVPVVISAGKDLVLGRTGDESLLPKDQNRWIFDDKHPENFKDLRPIVGPDINGQPIYKTKKVKVKNEKERLEKKNGASEMQLTILKTIWKKVNLK